MTARIRASSRRSWRSAVAAVLGLFLVAGACAAPSSTTTPDTAPGTASGTASGTALGTTAGAVAADPEALGRDAFLAGLPLVTTVRTMQTFAGLTGLNKVFFTRSLAAPTSRFIVAPNRDTVYALAILDLRGEPQVLTVPEIKDRYHVFQLIDAWMNNTGYIGTRATNGDAGSWVIVPPGYTGAIPPGLERIDAATNQVIMLGRIRATDDADAAALGPVRDAISLKPLSAVIGASPAPVPPPMAKPVGPPQTVGENGAAYFDELREALAVNPPVGEHQRAVFAATSASGLGVGTNAVDAAPGAPDVARQERAVRAGLADLADRSLQSGTIRNGWSVNVEVGRPDANLTLSERAKIARYYWGPNVAEEAVYPVARTASDGAPLDGAKRYVIHLDKENLPPVDAFWSYTLYGADMFFVPNAANHYSLSGETPDLVRNADGSIDIYVQREPPVGHESNWLPAPEGPFNLLMRLYLPQAPVLDGTYDYPPLTVIP